MEKTKFGIMYVTILIYSQLLNLDKKMIFRNHVIVTLEWGLGSINSLGLNKKISEIQGSTFE